MTDFENLNNNFQNSSGTMNKVAGGPGRTKRQIKTKIGGKLSMGIQSLSADSEFSFLKVYMGLPEVERKIIGLLLHGEGLHVWGQGLSEYKVRYNIFRPI